MAAKITIIYGSDNYILSNFQSDFNQLK